MLAWTTSPAGKTAPADQVDVALTGTADLTTHDELRVRLAELVAALVAQRATLVRFDLRELVFMNSSCVKEMIAFVDDLRVQRGLSCRVQFAGDKRHAWQRRTLRVLRIIEPNLVSIDLG